MIVFQSFKCYIGMKQDEPVCSQKKYCQVFQVSRYFYSSFWVLRLSEGFTVKRVLRDTFLSRDRPQLPCMLHCLPDNYSRRHAEQVLPCPHPKPFYRISSPVLNWIKFETMLQQEAGYKKWSESSELCHVQTPVFYFLVLTNRFRVTNLNHAGISFLISKLHVLLKLICMRI